MKKINEVQAVEYFIHDTFQSVAFDLGVDDIRADAFVDYIRDRLCDTSWSPAAIDEACMTILGKGM